MHKKFRLAGWLAVAGLLGTALIAPASTLATTLHAAHQGTSWDANGFQSNDCETTPGPGEVVWHFVLTSPDADSGHLTATFQKAGDVTVANLDKPSAVLHFEIVTGHDTLLDAETTDVDGGNLNLSHICAGKDQETASAPVQSAPVESAPVHSAPVESAPVESAPVESAPVESAPVESAPVESAPVESAPVESAPVESAPVESAPVESAPVESAPVESSPVESATPTPTPTPTPTATPSGKVDAETGTPDEGVTPPATDTIAAHSSTSNDGWQLVLVALAALLATVLILTPSARKNRR
jgi:hypothetical protein